MRNPSPYLLPGFPPDKKPKIWERKRILDIVELFDPQGAIDLIIAIVSSHTKITKEQICSKSRKIEIVQSRYLTMYLCAKYMAPSTGLSHIAVLMRGEGGSTRDHTSVIVGREAINDMLKDQTRGSHADETIEYLHKIEKQLKQTLDESNRIYWQSRER